VRSTRSTPPASQLHSVAVRYGPALRPRGAARRCSAVFTPRVPAAGRTSQRRPARERATLVRDARAQRLEAVLILAREPLSSRKLSEYVHLADGTEARTLVRRLNQMYDAAGRAFRVEEVAGGFQLLSRPKFAPWLRRLKHVPPEVRLSGPVLETLAVIAYRQPVLRADIEAIRGVNCGEIVRQLMDRDLVRISGRSRELGRPYLYSTTRRFLRVFGLTHIDKLPLAETLRNLSHGGGSANDRGDPGDGPHREPAPVPDSAESPREPNDPNPMTREMEETQVTVTMRKEFPGDDVLELDPPFPTPNVRAHDDDEGAEDIDEGDEDDDFDDEEDDFDDDDFDDEELDDEELDDEEEDLDEEWEEVEDDEADDEDEEWDEEDDEDLDDWDDDDEEEEESEEEDDEDWE